MKKCKVIYFKIVVVDDDVPQSMCIHQFTVSRKFNISVPLLYGFVNNVSDYLSMVNMARNKRASISYVEFFVHKKNAIDLDYFTNYNDYLIINYDRSIVFPV